MYMYMYMYMCVYVCMYIHTYIHTYIYIICESAGSRHLRAFMCVVWRHGSHHMFVNMRMICLLDMQINQQNLCETHANT